LSETTVSTTHPGIWGSREESENRAVLGKAGKRESGNAQTHTPIKKKITFTKKKKKKKKKKNPRMGIFTFGSGESFKLGTGQTHEALKPLAVAGGDTLPADATAAACGELHTAVIAGGKLYCFGSGGKGQLGTGNREAVKVPTAVGIVTTCIFFGFKIYVSIV
jgi:alpha-tubulin suppressor-like RCC1 family protein